MDVKVFQNRIKTLQEEINRLAHELYWRKTTKINSFRHYKQILYEIKHKDLTIAFNCDEIRVLKKQIAICKVLYGKR